MRVFLSRDQRPEGKWPIEVLQFITKGAKSDREASEGEKTSVRLAPCTGKVVLGGKCGRVR